MRHTFFILAFLYSISCSSQIHKARNEDLKATYQSNEIAENIKSSVQEYQAVQLEGTEVRQLTSQIVKGMEYKLYMSLPHNYESSTDSYPVLYFLDAWAQFGIIRQAYWLLRFYNEVPPETLGRLGYFTPISGGASDFVKFMEKELFPFIEEEYRAEKTDRAIFGVSYGGLLGTYALFNHTDLFKRYFIGSPPMWWDNEITLKHESDYAGENESLPVKVFLAIGGEENPESYNKLLDRLLSRNYKDLELTPTIFENETHMSVVPAAH